MVNRNQKNNEEDKFDALIKEALTHGFDEYNQSLEMPEEEIEFSEEHKKKMEILFAKYRRQERIRRFRSISARAACVVAAVAVVSTAAMFGAGAWRLKLMNFVFDPEKPGTEINFNDNGGTTYTDEYVRIKYVPMGFKVAEQTSNSKCDIVTFEYGEKYFIFSIGTIEGQMSIDTENAVMENIKVNGREGIYSSNENVNILLWHDDFNVFTVEGNIQREEMFKIAESTENFVDFE